jgi:radical SAM superfamily enzyme YgiQ (UPF0313 family)
VILRDAAHGELQPVYGRERRWQQELEAPVVLPPGREDLRRYLIPMLGLYPARGCPFLCNFCSVIKIAGRHVRSQRVETTLASLRAAQAAGVRLIMFTSDNFNKYPDAEVLLNAMIDEHIGLEFFVQCDTQIAKQGRLVDLMARAGCFQMFVGVESFNRQTLLAAHKGQNRPETYREIVRLCRAHGITSHFSNIVGFPQDTEPGVHEHLAALRDMDPSLASFYILCPIPGTEQYDDFLARGLIHETNLDRFDTTSLTWQHPHISAERMERLLFRCYREFFSVRHALDNATRFTSRGRKRVTDAAESAAMSLFSRYCAWRHTHPMSGGVRRVRRDGVGHYLPLRRETFGFDLAPLPRSLPLPPDEDQLNRLVNPRVRGQSLRDPAASAEESRHP